MIALIVTVVVFTSAGIAVAGIWPWMLSGTLTARLAAAFLLGVGSIGTLLFWIGVLHVPLRLPIFIGVVLGLMSLLPWSLRRLPSVRPDDMPWLPSLVLVVPFLGVFADALVVPLADWDGLITWLPKARAIAIDGSLYGPFFYGRGGLNLHNHYPLLLPLDDALLMRFLGLSDDRAVRWLYALIPFALLLFLRDRLVPIGGKLTAGWITAIVAWIPAITTGYGSAVSAYSDLAVAAFAGAGLLAFLTRPPDQAAREGGLWLTFLVLTKNEGAMLCLALLGTVAALRLIVDVRHWLLLLSGPASSLLVLTAWRSIVPDAYDERYPVLLRELPYRLDRLGEAATAFLTHLLDWRTWGVLWPAAGIAFLLALRCSPAERRWARVAGLFLALCVLGYLLILAVTSWNVQELARVTVDRLLLHLLVPLCYLLVLGLRGRAAPHRAADAMT